MNENPSNEAAPFSPVTMDGMTTGLLGGSVAEFSRKLQNGRPKVAEFIIAGNIITEHSRKVDDHIQAIRIIDLDTYRIKTIIYDVNQHEITSDKTGPKNKKAKKLVKFYRRIYKSHGLLGKSGPK